MKKLTYEDELKLIFESAEVLSTLKELDTILPPKAFKEFNNSVIENYEREQKHIKKHKKLIEKERRYFFRKLKKQESQKLKDDKKGLTKNDKVSPRTENEVLRKPNE